MYRYPCDVLVDIDECKRNIDGCNQYCNNTNGSYICYCEAKYVLLSDNHTCGKLFLLILGDNNFVHSCPA